MPIDDHMQTNSQRRTETETQLNGVVALLRYMNHKTDLIARIAGATARPILNGLSDIERQAWFIKINSAYDARMNQLNRAQVLETYSLPGMASSKQLLSY